MNCKFKVGDKVKLKDSVDIYDDIQYGVNYIIDNECYSCDKTHWITDEIGNTDFGNYIHEDHLELVDSNTTDIRTFDSGAVRDTSKGKLEYYGFMHPYLDFSFANYMNGHRTMSDGSLRDSNNWWGGFGKDVVIQSLSRHMEDLKLIHAGYHVYEVTKANGSVVKEVYKSKQTLVGKDMKQSWKEITIEDCCHAIRFNSQAYLLEVL